MNTYASWRAAIPLPSKGAQLVLFCVKSGDTECAGRADRVVCWQGNGGAVPAEWLDNDQRLRGVLAQPEVAAAVVFRRQRNARTRRCQAPRQRRTRDRPDSHDPRPCPDLEAAAIPTRSLRQRARRAVAQADPNCAYNAISAIARKPYGQTALGPASRK